MMYSAKQRTVDRNVSPTVKTKNLGDSLSKIEISEEMLLDPPVMGSSTNKTTAESSGPGVVKMASAKKWESRRPSFSKKIVGQSTGEPSSEVTRRSVVSRQASAPTANTPAVVADTTEDYTQSPVKSIASRFGKVVTTSSASSAARRATVADSRSLTSWGNSSWGNNSWGHNSWGNNSSSDCSLPRPGSPTALLSSEADSPTRKAQQSPRARRKSFADTRSIRQWNNNRNNDSTPTLPSPPRVVAAAATESPVSDVWVTLCPEIEEEEDAVLTIEKDEAEIAAEKERRKRAKEAARSDETEAERAERRRLRKERRSRNGKELKRLDTNESSSSAAASVKHYPVWEFGKTKHFVIPPVNNVTKKAAIQIQRAMRGWWQRLKFRIAFLQHKLDTREQRTESAIKKIRDETEQRKTRYYTIVKTKRDAKLDKELAAVESTVVECHNVIAYLRKENKSIREKNEVLAKEIKSYRVHNERLEKAKAQADSSCEELNQHIQRFLATRDQLQEVIKMFQHRVEIMNEALEDRQQFLLTEQRNRTSYSKGIAEMVQQIERSCRNPKLLEEVLEFVMAIGETGKYDQRR